MPLFLIAQIAGRTVAIESSQVESVVDIGAIVPIPRSERHVRGLAALRSRVVTVIETRAALGLPDVGVGGGGSGAMRAVITIVDGHHYALLVDALEDVAAFELSPLSAGVVLENGWQRVGRGVIVRDEAPILAIELASLIPGITAMAA